MLTERLMRSILPLRCCKDVENRPVHVSNGVMRTKTSPASEAGKPVKADWQLVLPFPSEMGSRLGFAREKGQPAADLTHLRAAC